MRRFTRRFSACLLAGLALLAPTTASADITLFGTTLVNPQFISINTTTGTGTLLGTPGSAASPFGLATYNNQLFTFDGNTSSIVRIDPNTNSTASTTLTTTGPVAGQGGFAIRSDGVAFLTTALDPTSFDPVNNFYQINLASGVASAPISTAASIEALAFSGSSLFALDRGTNNADSISRLYTIDTTNGAMSLIGSTGLVVGSPTGGMTFGASGTLYATLDDKLYTLSLTTGLATAVGSSDPTLDTGFGSITGLAFANTAVPEPSSMALMGVGAIGLIVAARRRRS